MESAFNDLSFIKEVDLSELQSEVQDRIEVTVNGKSQEFFMSYGLLLRLTQMANVYGEFQEWFINPQMQTAVLDLMFQTVLKDEKKAFIDYEISREDAELLVDWCGGHLTNHFLKGLGKLQKAMGPVLKRVPALSGGSED